ncbi:hypothetical protein [Halovenus halobia]|uniref:hypothetical protein n=1 Tax=Halovenus halobia TaxID=3396622 RepID=UPI003F56077D
MRRRQVLAGGIALSAALAGCIENSPDSDERPEASFRVSLLGQTATGLDIEREPAAVETTIATELDIDPVDVAVVSSAAAVEVRRGDFSPSEFVAALSATGFAVDSADVRAGVTAPTAVQARDTLRGRFDRADISGVSVSTESDGDAPALLVEVRETDADRVSDIVTEDNPVQVVLATPADQPDATDPETEVLLEADDFERVSEAKPADNRYPSPYVTVQLTRAAADRFQRRLVETGYTADGVTGPQACGWEAGTEPDPNEYCLYTMLDGDIVNGSGLNQSFASTLDSEQFGGGYAIITTTLDEAQATAGTLRRGVLPTAVELERIGD